MGYPDLKSDESIILTAQHVKVKSVPFELVLTNRRLIIIDSEKNVVPTQQIPLITIRNVMIGENAIRDPVITLTILTDTADTRELALTFAMQTGGERRREAGEWVKDLKKYIAEASSYPVEMMTDSPPAAQPPRQDYAGSSGIKKKIEVSRPIKKIVVETNHLPPKPVETSTLPEGTFCCRCGNRIPPGSTFCNRCGTKVVVPGEPEAPAPTAPTAVIPEQIATAPAAAAPPGDRKSRPIEQIIHSIEPLIEDSVPRAGPAAAIPEPEEALAPVPAAEPASAPADQSAEPVATAPENAAADAQVPAADAAAPVATAEPSLEIPPVPPLPPVPSAPKKKRSGIITIAIILVIVIAIAAGGYMLLKNGQSPVTTPPVTTTVPPTTSTTVPTVKPTANVTTAASTVTTTAIPTTAASIVPQTGIWAEVIYDKTYTGLVGTPGSKVTVTDTGDHFYIIPTKDGMVDITLSKTDGSGDELKVIVYSAGQVVKTASTTTPKGSLNLQFAVALPTTAVTPEAIATLAAAQATAASVNATNSTA